MQNKLSIFIPTYNRWGVLAKTLEKTLSKNLKKLHVLIIDNDSNSFEKEKVVEIINKYPQISCTIIKNEMNLGGDGNLLRCIELCQSTYILLLGDDDFLSDDYATKISNYLDSENVWGFISFTDRICDRCSDFAFDSPYELVKFSNDWSELLFTSTSVFNKDILKSGMWEAQRAQFTCSSHLVGLLKGWEKLKGNGKNWQFLLSAQQLIVSSGHARQESSFELINVFAGLPLLEYFFQEKKIHSIVRSAVRGGTRRVFKPRVLAKVFFRYTLKFGLLASWRLMLPIRRGLSYSIGNRAFFYWWYLPLVIFFAALVRAVH